MQLTITDNWGMTLTMVAAESGMVLIIRAVLGRITLAKACACTLGPRLRSGTTFTTLHKL